MNSITRRGVLFFSLCALALATFAPASSAQRMRNRLGPATMRVTAAAGYERVDWPTGATLDNRQRFAATGRNRWNTGPLKDGLATALCYAREADVVEVQGTVAGVLVGGDPTRTGEASWPRDALGQLVPVSCAIVGADPSGAVMGLSIKSSFGGIGRLVVCGLTIRGPPGATSAVTVYQGSDTGRLCLWECTIEPADRSSWAGCGYKWPIRAHGHLHEGIEVVGCVVSPGFEWGIAYCDNLGPSRFAFIRRHPGAPANLMSTNGLFQVANRAVNGTNWRQFTQYLPGATDTAKQQYASVVAGGPSGYGLLVFEDLDLTGWNCGSAGGAVITVAGHQDAVRLSRVKARDYLAGAFVLWADASKGLWQDQGYVCDRLTLEDVDFESSQNDRAHVAIDATRRVIVRGFRIAGARTALDLDNAYGSPGVPIGVGELVFDGLGQPSKYGGWQTPVKFLWSGVTVSAARMDAMVPAEPSSH